MIFGSSRWLAAAIVAVIATLGVFVVWRLTADPIPAAHRMFEPHGSPISAERDGEHPTIQLTPHDQRKIGVETTEVRKGAVYSEIIAPARVEELEAAVRTIGTPLGGRIDRLFADAGQHVHEGQPLALIYSSEQAMPATIHSDSTGIVRARNVTEGRFVGAGEVLYVLIDLSTVTVKADVFSSDIGRIHPGLGVQITSDALDGVKLRGSVRSVESRSDPQTGTTPVHIQMENPGMRLRPGMFVRTIFQLSSPSDVLSVPRTAVIDTGLEKIVYVASNAGVFERRNVELGPAGKHDYPVVKGLVEGDRVVTRGGFLIDSQTRLTSGIAGLFSGSRTFAGSADQSASFGAAYRVRFRMKPERPLAGQQNTIGVTIVDASGNTINDAQVRAALIMPAMPSMGMPEMRSAADLQWSGSDYTGSITVAMAGSWNVTVEARRGNQLIATYRTRFDAR